MNRIFEIQYVKTNGIIIHLANAEVDESGRVVNIMRVKIPDNLEELDIKESSFLWLQHAATIPNRLKWIKNYQSVPAILGPQFRCNIER